jgi:hypothetical protein
MVRFFPSSSALADVLSDYSLLVARFYYYLEIENPVVFVVDVEFWVNGYRKFS